MNPVSSHPAQGSFAPGAPARRNEAAPALLEVDDLLVRYRSGLRPHTAVDGVSLRVQAGRTVALIGESGCGKSSLAKAVTRLIRPASGSIRFDGRDWTALSARQLRPHRCDLQMVFQDPLAALDGRQRIGRILEIPLALHRVVPPGERKERVAQLLEQVGLPADFRDRFPHELSGGQRQRVNIARALATRPRLIVCDEPVSALDVTLQAQILALLKDLQQRLGVAYLFISHDLSVVQDIADRILVMQDGRLVEALDGGNLWRDAVHPYTRSLLASVPGASPAQRRIIAPAPSRATT